ncbi:MAG TPA: hypothetical protein VFS60_10485 [Thermoanaerobaculia bacterium]|nr:hypothetical protein [Thermoanaerobaculia bacterium]
MKELVLTRRGAHAWAHWRSRRAWWHAERCHHCAGLEHRCAWLEARVAVLTAELQAAREQGGGVVVEWPDGSCLPVPRPPAPCPPATRTPGSRTQAFVDGIFASLHDHPAVWGFIGTIVVGVFGYVTYHLVVLLMTIEGGGAG